MKPLSIGQTLIGNIDNPLDDLSPSSYAFIVIFLLGSITCSENPKDFTKIRVQMFKLVLPLIKTHLT